MDSETKHEALRKAYERSGMSYKKLADFLGLRENTLACWLTNKRTPPEYTVVMIVEKIENYLGGGGVYISKEMVKEQFIKEVYRIFDEVEEKKQPQEVVKAFERLPTVIVKPKVKRG